MFEPAERVGARPFGNIRELDSGEFRLSARPLAGFPRLRWGEVTALRRCDLDTLNGTVRVQAAYVKRSNGEMILGPTKSRVGLRTISIPASIVPPLEARLEKYVRPDESALVFTGLKGGPLRRSGFDKVTRWRFVVEALGAANLHFP
ncbi:hypothetical protein [Actinomadura verrucosospora]|uniref:hypothetical protein n=1 Tax=Actinomadura verrucosospora TaxID=46165 RepID=UPI0015630DD0|nr:hypothetical protein [Actinomadura verrucosospora]